MPTTYTPLATTTLGSSQASVTLSGISGSYTDLVLVISAQGTSAGNDQDINMTFNSDTGTNYSRTRFYGNGVGVFSTRESNVSSITIGNMPAASSSLGLGNSVIQINSYANSSVNKTALIRTNTASTYGTVFSIVGLWRNTAAITSITLTPAGGSFATGSTFSLYGIASAAVVSGAKATGGDVVATDGTYWYHAFRASGTFTPTQALTCDVLQIAGGGGGAGRGSYAGGGGGAGGVSYVASQALSATAYSVTVGAGGAGSLNGDASNGNNSQFGSLTAAVYGGAGAQSGNGYAGGSGGGAGGGNPGTGGAGTAGQGNAGGNGARNGFLEYASGGGGGVSAVGANGVVGTSGGNGGAGTNTYSSWATATGTGVSGFYAGGGGGGYGVQNGYTQRAGGTGGSGGGAAGAGSNGASANAIANTGGGGGGGSANENTGSLWNYTGTNGGSGLVIVRYAV